MEIKTCPKIQDPSSPAVSAAMAEFDRWENARELSLSFQEEGWLSPDTYCKNFRELPSGPAIYVLMPFCREFYERAFVAYVGMSINLEQRLTGHEVVAEIQCHDVWVKRWFKPTPKALLRYREREYIRRFDPPWNIIHRPRGVSLP